MRTVCWSRLTLSRAGSCLVRFTVTPTKRGNIVRVFGVQHSGHPDVGKPPRHVGQWCHALIRATYFEREGVTVAEVRNKPLPPRFPFSALSVGGVGRRRTPLSVAMAGAFGTM